jgi:hypothetical protein
MKEVLKNKNQLLQMLMSQMINDIVVNQFIYEESKH